MAKTLTQDVNTVADTVADNEVDLKAAVRECIAELEATTRRMAERQTRINKLKAETRAMLIELKAL